MVQVLASFLVQDLEAEGLNPFLLTYIANSLFIIYLPAYALVKQFASHRLKGRHVICIPSQPYHSTTLCLSQPPKAPSLVKMHALNAKGKSLAAIPFRHGRAWTNQFKL